MDSLVIFVGGVVLGMLFTALYVLKQLKKFKRNLQKSNESTSENKSGLSEDKASND